MCGVVRVLSGVRRSEIRESAVARSSCSGRGVKQ